MFFVILLLISIGYFATDIYLPSLPAIGNFYNTSDNLMQLTLFSYLLTFALTPVVFGPLSDTLGRIKIVKIGLFITLIATVCCYIPVNIYWLIAFRALQGAGTGAIVVTTRAIITDVWSGKELAQKLSYITMCMPLVLALAPVIGGLLQDSFNWQSVFLFLALYIVSIRLCLRIVFETIERKDSKNLNELFKTYKKVIKKPSFMLYTMCLVLPNAGLFAYITASPFLFQNNLGLTASEYGFLALYLGGAIVLSSYINAKLLYRVEIHTMQIVGGIAIIASGLLLFVTYIAGVLSKMTLLVPCMLYFTSIAFACSNSVSKAMGQIKSNYGAASAVITMTQFLTGALASFIFSLTTNHTVLPLAVCFTVVGVLYWLTLTLAQKQESFI